MEVKIKQGAGLIDATIEMVDGVMVVSPKEEKVEPKDGDVFCVDLLHPCVGIVKEEYSFGKPDKDRLYFSVGYWKQSGSMQFGTFCACNRNTESNYRPATGEERQELFDKLKEEGYEWDAEKKELVKLKWKPKIGETYYRPDFQHCKFICYSGITDYKKLIYIKYHINKGWVFRTKEECEEFCNRLNKAINSVKP
jgi:hypothetical protein